MVKETRKMLIEREEKERAERGIQERETYLPRLMTLLERAQKVNFELSVKDGVFVLHERDDRDFGDIKVPIVYEGDDWDSGFNFLERYVGWKEDQIKEANRKFLAKQVALAKLTQEERVLLNL